MGKFLKSISDKLDNYNKNQDIKIKEKAQLKEDKKKEAIKSYNENIKGSAKTNKENIGSKLETTPVILTIIGLFSSITLTCVAIYTFKETGILIEQNEIITRDASFIIDDLLEKRYENEAKTRDQMALLRREALLNNSERKDLNRQFPSEENVGALKHAIFGAHTRISQKAKRLWRWALKDLKFFTFRDKYDKWHEKEYRESRKSRKDKKK